MNALTSPWVNTFPKSAAAEPIASKSKAPILSRTSLCECLYDNTMPGSFFIWVCQPIGQSASITLW